MRGTPPSLLLTGPSLQRLWFDEVVHTFHSVDLHTFKAAATARGAETRTTLPFCQPRVLELGWETERCLDDLFALDTRILSRVEEMCVSMANPLSGVQNINSALGLCGESLQKLRITFLHDHALNLHPLKNLTSIVLVGVRGPTYFPSFLPALKSLNTLDDGTPLQSLELEMSNMHNVDSWDDPASLAVRPLDPGVWDTREAIDECLATIIRRFPTTFTRVHLNSKIHVKAPCEKPASRQGLARETGEFEMWKERAEVLMVTPEELFPVASSKENVLFDFSFPWGGIFWRWEW
ncbi:hypothetical protein CC2G_012195 [Coprinopsis cinerea AmutBmut pab1-1]|nr:hypothetical protein CC2G_012195 [Coprinopsis cinerea AmutBmut pab1-1]